jgi:hypothetical protein
MTIMLIVHASISLLFSFILLIHFYTSRAAIFFPITLTPLIILSLDVLQLLSIATPMMVEIVDAVLVFWILGILQHVFQQWVHSVTAFLPQHIMRSADKVSMVVQIANGVALALVVTGYALERSMSEQVTSIVVLLGAFTWFILMARLMMVSFLIPRKIVGECGWFTRHKYIEVVVVAALTLLQLFRLLGIVVAYLPSTLLWWVDQALLFITLVLFSWPGLIKGMALPPFRMIGKGTGSIKVSASLKVNV